MSSARFLTLYYLAGTVAFAFIDWVLTAPIRAAFLGLPRERFVYYGVLLGLGLLCRAKPRWAPIVGIAESSINLLLVLLSIMLPIYALSDQVAAGGSASLPFTGLTLANVALTGSVLIYSFHRSQRALLKQRGHKK